jgi:hypothetical protein
MPEYLTTGRLYLLHLATRHLNLNKEASISRIFSSQRAKIPAIKTGK